MKVKEIIKCAAKMINLNNVIDSIDNNIIDEEIETMLTSLNIINNSIASNYIELQNVSTVHTSIGIIPFSEISDKDIIEIKEVLSNNKDNVNYQIMSDGIHLNNGSYEIRYTYYPDSVTIDDDINYYLKLNTTLFAVGVVAEYLFLKGDVEEAAIWDKKFKQLLFGVSRPRRSIVMPRRRWL